VQLGARPDAEYRALPEDQAGVVEVTYPPCGNEKGARAERCLTRGSSYPPRRQEHAIQVGRRTTCWIIELQCSALFLQFVPTRGETGRTTLIALSVRYAHHLHIRRAEGVSRRRRCVDNNHLQWDRGWVVELTVGIDSRLGWMLARTYARAGWVVFGGVLYPDEVKPIPGVTYIKHDQGTLTDSLEVSAVREAHSAGLWDTGVQWTRGWIYACLSGSKGASVEGKREV
jgi:hypothetical protein